MIYPFRFTIGERPKREESIKADLIYEVSMWVVEVEEELEQEKK